MNENLNLLEILKDCPIGTKLYSSVHGEVELEEVHLDSKPDYPIEVRLSNNSLDCFTTDGRLFAEYNGECMLFPSREQHDWSKFNPNQTNQPESEEWCESQEITKWAYISDPLSKQPKFDPKILQPFDKVLVRDSDETTLVGDLNETRWKCALYSHEIENKYSPCKYVTTDSPYMYCIPYNDDTKHLVGTTDEAPEFYRYWED